MRNNTRKHVYHPLRITFGLVPILAGLDKFAGILADWGSYMSPVALDLIPLPPGVILGGIGIVEVAVGAMVLSRWTRLGAYLAAGWLTLIAINLVTMGTLDIAVRDLVMAVAAYGLAHLAGDQERELETAR